MIGLLASFPKWVTVNGFVGVLEWPACDEAVVCFMSARPLSNLALAAVGSWVPR